MIISREDFIQELQLREQIRKVIQIVKKRKALTEQAEEQQLRSIIRELIAEAEIGSENSDRPTGIRILDEEVLQNIINTFRRYYKQLAKPEQRESFRTHIINATENLLNRIESGQLPADSAPEVESPAPMPVNEQEAISLDVSGGAQSDPMFIDVPDDDLDADEQAKQDFRTGVEGSLSPDQEIGAERAQVAFNGPDTTIENAYKTLRGEDANLFREYLITNLKLHFDAMEEELTMPAEPTTPSYEEEAAAGPAGPPGMEALPPEPLPPAPPMGAPEDEGLPPPPPIAQ